MLELGEKLSILADAAKYDVSCSSSGSSRRNKPGGLGNSHISGICHSWSDDGRCISLLKILMTNDCVYDCVYCVNRVSNDIPKATFTPDDIAELTINFYRRNYIEGLFLSSAVHKNPNYTMELLVETVRKIRYEGKFNGYIHLKGIPGADSKLIEEAGRLVDRLSVNIELPSDSGLKLLAPQKKHESIIQPMKFIQSKIMETIDEKKGMKRFNSFVPAGQTTQLIVGATVDNDRKIIKLSENLYQKLSMKRVYYSAYVPIVEHPNLPVIAKPPLIREHRLYQADWLLRFYKFQAKELLDDENPNFDMEIDPKCGWALRNLHLFPVEINRCDFETLLRIPGIGVKSAQRILIARNVCSLSYDNLKKIGVVLKRARFFITCQGKYYGDKNINEIQIRANLISGEPIKTGKKEDGEQLSFFSSYPTTAPMISINEKLQVNNNALLHL